MEYQRTAPHSRVTRHARLRRLAAAAAGALALAATTAQGGGLGAGPEPRSHETLLARHDGSLVAAARNAELIAAANVPERPSFEPTDVALQGTEAPAASALPMLETNVAEEPWPSAAADRPCIPGALQLETDCASLGITGGNPVTILLSESGNRPTSALGAVAANKSSPVGASVNPPQVQDSAGGYSGPILWTIAAIAASGLGVAGLRGPLLAARWTPARRGMRA